MKRYDYPAADHISKLELLVLLLLTVGLWGLIIAAVWQVIRFVRGA